MATANNVALHVLTDRNLLATITAFSPSLEEAMDQLMDKLICATNKYYYLDAPYAQDIELWQRAVCAGDKPTLEAFRVLSKTSVMDMKLPEVLVDIVSFAVLHTKDLALLDWIADRFDYSENYERFPESTARALGEQGDMEIIKWVLSRAFYVINDVMCSAASKGHMKLVKSVLDFSENLYFECGQDLIRAAIESDQLPMLQYALENTPRCFHHNACTAPGDINYAAKVGAFNAVQFLHERQPPTCTTDAMDDAAANGHLAVVRFLHEHREEGCTTKAMDEAAMNGHLAVVEYLNKNRIEGCKVDTLFECDKRGFEDVAKYLCMRRPMANPQRAIARARGEGRLKLLAKLEESVRFAEATYAYMD